MLNNETTINKTQSSFIKSSQFLHSNLFPYRFKDQYPRMVSNFTLTNKKISKSCHNQTSSSKKISHHFSQSRTVNIQFNSTAKKIIPEDIIMRRKMMSSSEKYYNKKKTIIFNFIRQKNQKDQDMMGSGKNFLKIGTHHISKINLEHNLQQQGLKTQETSQPKKRLSIFKKKYQKQKRFSSKQQSFVQSNSILVLQKKQLTKTQDFFATLPPTFRKMAENGNIEALLKQKTQPLLQDKSIKSTEFQQFIPIRKRKMKKQPFVFGMSDKAFFSNPQKNTQKLLIYQDFLWKLNYSNGLFVKIPQNDPLYKAYIGPGNNCNLIKTILKRRFWWTITQKMQNCQFVWTQLKTNSLYKQQKSSQTDITKLYTYHLHEGCVSQDADHHSKIFNSVDLLNWTEHKVKNNKFQETINEKTYKHRINFYKCKSISLVENSNELILHNHLQSNYYIGNKKALFYFMKNYYQLKKQNVFNALPLTFHIVRGISDQNYKSFLKLYHQLQQRKRKGEDIKNIWIIKPGQNSNRGNGISVCFNLDDIKHRINGRQRNNDGNLRTFILQKYIERPLLYKGRKFDIRHYMLITCFNGIFKAYWYPQGYIRTSSSKFSLKKNADLFIHLTNDAVQKYSQQYGKYQKGNKISYQAFQEYLNKTSINTKQVMQGHENNIFFQQILPKMKNLALDAIKSTYLYLDKQRKQHNFELLGMDFMIDSQMKPYLIQINTNPCLQLSCPLLARIIPNLIQQTFKLCIDPLFPPPQEWQNSKKMYFSESPIEDITYQLFFDEAIDGNDVKLLLQNKGEIDRNMGKVDEDAQTFENDGNIEEDI